MVAPVTEEIEDSYAMAGDWLQVIETLKQNKLYQLVYKKNGLMRENGNKTLCSQIVVDLQTYLE